MKRRELIKGAAMVASMPVTRLAAAEMADPPAAGGDRWRGLKAGVASYTLRKMPLEAAITAIKRVGLSYVSIKDFHLSLDSTTEQRKAVAAQFKAAGITPLSCGNVGMKNDAADIRRAFEYARDIGLPTIVCSPEPESMKILDAMVKEFDIKLAIHNHAPRTRSSPLRTTCGRRCSPTTSASACASTSATPRGPRWIRRRPSASAASGSTTAT